MIATHGGVPVKLAEIATVTVTVRPLDVSVIKQEPVALPFVLATVVHEKVVDALEELVAVQFAILVMPETDHE